MNYEREDFAHLAPREGETKDLASEDQNYRWGVGAYESPSSPSENGRKAIAAFKAGDIPLSRDWRAYAMGYVNRAGQSSPPPYEAALEMRGLK